MTKSVKGKMGAEGDDAACKVEKWRTLCLWTMMATWCKGCALAPCVVFSSP